MNLLIDEPSWSSRAAKLVDTLINDGALRTSVWTEAFRSTPRHVFVPIIRTEDGPVGPGTAGGTRTGSSRDEWLSQVYKDTTLTTTSIHDQAYGADISVSSSTRPALMARMLEILDIKPGMRVLEIGTGTGYNAALLCHVLGSENVCSIDIDDALVAAARQNLAVIGYAPALTCCDGDLGYPEVSDNHFDRIIATCAVPTIPIPWVRQLRPGGLVLANVRGELAGGPLCLATKDADGDTEAIGHFINGEGHFMWSRPRSGQALPYTQNTIISRDPQRTTADPNILHGLLSELVNPDFRFLAQLQIPGIRSLTGTSKPGPTITAYTIDGEHLHAELKDERTAHVAQTGPRRLWDTLAATLALWLHIDQPPATRYGVVVTPSVQFVYLDDDHAWTRWPLPMITAERVATAPPPEDDSP